jgi:hypothetical protein
MMKPGIFVGTFNADPADPHGRSAWWRGESGVTKLFEERIDPVIAMCPEGFIKQVWLWQPGGKIDTDTIPCDSTWVRWDQHEDFPHKGALSGDNSIGDLMAARGLEWGIYQGGVDKDADPCEPIGQAAIPTAGDAAHVALLQPFIDDGATLFGMDHWGSTVAGRAEGALAWHNWGLDNGLIMVGEAWPQTNVEILPARVDAVPYMALHRNCWQTVGPIKPWWRFTGRLGCIFGWHGIPGQPEWNARDPANIRTTMRRGVVPLIMSDVSVAGNDLTLTQEQIDVIVDEWTTSVAKQLLLLH